MPCNGIANKGKSIENECIGLKEIRWNLRIRQFNRKSGSRDSGMTGGAESASILQRADSGRAQ
jgi:hypothetical protein